MWTSSYRHPLIDTRGQRHNITDRRLSDNTPIETHTCQSDCNQSTLPAGPGRPVAPVAPVSPGHPGRPGSPVIPVAPIAPIPGGPGGPV